MNILLNDKWEFISVALEQDFLAGDSRTILILLLLGGGVPEGGGGRKKKIPLRDCSCIMFSTTPPFGHPSSQEEGN
jgi:hypothetical protein